MSLHELSEEIKGELKIELKSLYKKLLDINLNKSEVNLCFREFEFLMRKSHAVQQYFGEGIDRDIANANHYKKHDLVYKHLFKAVDNMKDDIEVLYNAIFDEQINAN